MPLRPPAGFISAFFDPLRNPNAPTIGTATGGDASASVTFTPPTNVGGSAISLYSALSTPGGVVASAASSPISVTGLTNGTAYTFAVWATNTYGPSAYSAASGSVTPTAVVGVFAGGYENFNTLSYITIATTGNATNFGVLVVNNSGTRFAESLAGCASSTRGVFGGGFGGGSRIYTTQYITFSSLGNAATFGALLGGQESNSGVSAIAALSSSTRGVFGGGNLAGTRSNVMAYITIASTGDATDFGDLTVSRIWLAGCSSPTRGVFGGGETAADTYSNVIDYITIASTGNATDFGDLANRVDSPAACSSSTRGLFAGGYNDTISFTNVINYITIASTGNATDFGDLTVARRQVTGCSSTVRGVFAAGQGSGAGSGYINVIDYVTIASTGNATDFGDLTYATGQLGACSNAHGGL
jgi:hypothetical protein